MRALTTVDCEYLSQGVAAAYLRAEWDEVAILETCTARSVPRLLAQLDAQGFAREQVRYVVVTHVHLDHAGGASALVRACPNATLLCHPRAERHLLDPSRLVASAQAVYGAQRFAELYGTLEPIPATRVKAVGDRETVPFGVGELAVHHVRGHANHHLIVHDALADAVFTGDAFGLVYPRLQRGALFAFPSTSPTDFDAAEAHAAVSRILGLGAGCAYPTHFGEVRELNEVAAQLHRWLVASQGLVLEARHRPPEERLAFIRAGLDREMAEAATRAGLSLSAEDWAFLELDLGLNAQGLAHAAGRAA
ncbi:MAG: MBL fold metallo-hydrolase [Deltaproteobacteria bacterium]|nr:MBL fold metallo-hydrolase [Deltaproteobacteria bacterium]